MAFNSIDYVLFLAVAFGVFWALARRPGSRMLFLLVASYAFYTTWNGRLVGLILISSAIDYLCGGLIARWPDRPKIRKVLLLTSVLSNLAILGFFKYANFFIENVTALGTALGVPLEAAPLDLILPVGISFYTFQSMSYTLDIYRGELRPARSLRDFLVFVAFFPQLIAGPIVRAKEFLPQLRQPSLLGERQLVVATYRLLRGFTKKMLIADYLAATIVDPVFQSPETASAPETFLALVAFHFQVYCDFSGYTDIAIGSAALFGFVLPENFDTPYAAHSPGDYWRRWHMTLSRFCFDYIYRPLGGNKGGEARTALNTLITFSVIGFWHGANWNYVLFGVYHALGVIFGRMLMIGLARRQGMGRTAYEASLKGKVIPIVLTNLVIIGSLPLFRSPDLPTAWAVYAQLLNFSTLRIAFQITPLLVLLVAVLTHFTPDRWEAAAQVRLARLHPMAQATLVFAITTTVLHMATIARQSFVYFQF